MVFQPLASVGIIYQEILKKFQWETYLWLLLSIVRLEDMDPMNITLESLTVLEVQFKTQSLTHLVHADINFHSVIC